MPKKKPETEEDKKSLKRLQKLLKRAQGFLKRINAAVIGERSGLNHTVRDSLRILWTDASAKIDGVHESLEIGASAERREGLDSAGLFGAELAAKEDLFEFCLEENRAINALKLLASIFASLAKIFPVLSAVKEYIDAVLCVRDWLKDPEFTSLGDLR